MLFCSTPPDELVARSVAMHSVLDALSVVARSPLPVLIQGEAGTGRAHVGRLLHAMGPRCQEPCFMMAGQALAESTESGQGHPDLDALLASRGTLLIRDLGDLPRAAQEELGAWLASGDQGSRILATCEPELAMAARSGSFHAGLFAVLNAHTIEIPPLRERVEDIVPLFEAWVNRHTEALGRGRMTVSSSAYDRLTVYPWPGNVAELARVARRAVLRAGASRIEQDHLDAILPVMAEYPAPAEMPFEDMIRTKLAALLRSVDGYPLKSLYSDVMAWVERPLLKGIMEHTGGNQLRASEILGLNRNTLRRKLSVHGLLHRTKGVLGTKTKNSASQRAKVRASSRP